MKENGYKFYVKYCTLLGNSKLLFLRSPPVADLGEGPGGAGPPLFWTKKEEMTEGKNGRQGQVSQDRPPPLAQGLDPPLTSLYFTFSYLVWLEGRP